MWEGEGTWRRVAAIVHTLWVVFFCFMFLVVSDGSSRFSTNGLVEVFVEPSAVPRLALRVLR